MSQKEIDAKTNSAINNALGVSTEVNDEIQSEATRRQTDAVREELTKILGFNPFS